MLFAVMDGMVNEVVNEVTRVKYHTSSASMNLRYELEMSQPESAESLQYMEAGVGIEPA